MKNTLVGAVIAIAVLFQFSIIAQVTPGKLVFKHGLALSYQTADVNGDGLADIISRTSQNGPEIYLNEGNFIFNGPRKIELPDDDIRNFYGLIDFDRDGDLDMLSANCVFCGNDDLRLFENINNERFEEHSTIQLNVGGVFTIVNYAVHDWNDDGFDDFVAVTGNKLYQFTNLQDGNFSLIANESHSLDTDPEFVDVSDIDLDGDQDVVVFDRNKMLTYIATNGSLTFTQNNPAPGIASFRMGRTDVNGDGVADYYGRPQNCIRVMLSNGVGGFNPPADLHCGEFQESGHHLTDLNGDGALDIVHGNVTIDGLFVRYNDNGQYLPSEQITYVGEQLYSLNTADLNGDLKDELIVFGDDQFLGVVEHQGANRFFTHGVASILRARQFDMHGIDSEEKNDISLIWDDWIGFKRWNGMEYGGVETIYNSREWVSDVNYADMNGDGKPDAIILLDPDVSPGVDTCLFWIDFSSDPTMTPNVLLTDEHDGEHLEVFDVEKDGDMDIVVFFDDMATLLLSNNGDGSFNEDVMGGTAWDAELFDVNQDGFMDVLSWNQTGRAYYFENDQQGGFESRKNVGPSDRPEHITAFDWDNDGDLDPTITFTGGTNRLAIWRNDNGSFDEEIVIESNVFSHALQVVDLLGNGQPGILSGLFMNFYEHMGGFNFAKNLGNYENGFEQMESTDVDQNMRTDILAYDGELLNGGVFFFPDIAVQVQIVDQDMDGFPSDVDCDDNNADINPDADEIVNNDVDENCDGVAEMIDNDMDGFNSDEDCDDMNADINPDAIDIPDNGIDEDCNGVDATTSVYTPVTMTQLKTLDADGLSVLHGSLVSVSGVVHGINFRPLSGGGLAALIDDDGEGVWIFAPNNNVVEYIYSEGDRLIVNGEVASFNGLLQIDMQEVTLQSGGQTLQTPGVVVDLDESTEGDLIKLEGFNYVDVDDWTGGGGSMDIEITNGSKTFLMRIDNDTELSTMSAPPSPFNVTGLGGQYDESQPYSDGYQILPRYLSDFETTTSTKGVKIEPFVVFPIPARDMIFFETEGQEVEFEIRTAQGVRLNTGFASQISIADLAPGIYSILSEGKVGRFVKL